jgi:hypothetical protein
MEPTIFQLSFQHQLNKLLIEPILAVQNRHGITATLARIKPMLIVIDGLDECPDKNLMADLIQSIIDMFHMKHQLPIRVFCTSRIEEHLRQKLQSNRILMLDLHDFNACADIRTFFRYHLSKIYKENRTMHSLPQPWPADADLDTLVLQSDGSFIFADTLVNFINDGNDYPYRKIQKALTMDAGLDTLYAEVLSAAPHTSHFERIIGTIMLLHQPLSIISLGHLLQLETADVLQALLGLQSILLIPTDDDQPVKFIHNSLRDFLMVQSRSRTLCINPPIRHLSIAIDCLLAIGSQPKNGVYYDGAQGYACLYWCDHFLQGLSESRGDHLFCSPLGASFISCLIDFSLQSLDFWINTVICNGKGEIVNLLGAAISSLEVSQIFSLLFLQTESGQITFCSRQYQIVH